MSKQNSTDDFLLSEDKIFIDDKKIYTHMILNYQDPGPHSHSFIEFFYVLNGSCEHSLDDKATVINCGDAYLLTPKNKHRFNNIGAPFIHRDIIFKLDYFKAVCDLYSPLLYDKIFEGEISNKIALTSKQINDLEILIQSINERNDFEIDVITTYICTFIINMFLDSTLNFKNSGRPEWIERLLSLLSTPENFKTDQNVLIAAFPYSQEYICRTFKSLTGTTITDYFNEQKIKYAYSLLTTSAYSIEQICELINFNNISYFYRLFKKYFNTTPRKIVSRQSDD